MVETVGSASGRERFWANVHKGESCWEWTAGVQNMGYGDFQDAGRRWVTHRYSWAIHFGEIPKGLCVLHHCDNPRCVRPDHLFLGTKRDNSQDMVAKGRHRIPRLRGEALPCSKLTDAAVRDIRARYRRGFGASLAREYGVDRTLITKLVAGKIWTHVGGKTA